LHLTVDKLELQEAQDLGVVVALLLEQTSCAVKRLSIVMSVHCHVGCFVMWLPM